MSDLSDHARRNRAEWTAWAPGYADEAPRAWAAEEITWGVWGVPESEVRVLPESVEGLGVVELGCGTAYVSAWLARRGARPVGVDLTPAQLDTARAMLLRRSGLEVLDLVELRAPEEGPEHRYPGLPERWWARQWPSEEIWRACKL